MHFILRGHNEGHNEKSSLEQTDKQTNKQTKNKKTFKLLTPSVNSLQQSLHCCVLEAFASSSFLTV